MDRVTRNIRFLLWKNGAERNEWLSRLSEWLGCSSERAGALLEGQAALTSKERQALDNATGLAAKDLAVDLIEKEDVDILAANVRYLISSLPHGHKKEFAAKLGVDVTTVSRWTSGAQRPTRKKLEEMRGYFGLPPEIDLNSDPVFLRTEPISESQMKGWIMERIQQMDGKALREIFPALKILLNK